MAPLLISKQWFGLVLLLAEMIDSLQFSPEILTKMPTSGLDVETTLSHFAILTYLVEVENLRPHIHQRFELDCITLPMTVGKP